MYPDLRVTLPLIASATARRSLTQPKSVSLAHGLHLWGLQMRDGSGAGASQRWILDGGHRSPNEVQPETTAPSTKWTDGTRIAKPPTPHSSLLSPGAQGRGPIEGSQSLGPADVADLIPGNPSGRQSA